MADRKILDARLRRLRDLLRESKLGGVLLVPGPNLRYLTSVNSLLLERPFMLLVPLEGTPRLVAPRLEAGPYKECGVDLAIHEWTDSEGWDGAIEGAAKELRPKGTWGAEGKVPFLYMHRLGRHMPVRFGDAEPLMQALREVKDGSEIALLRRSAKILSKSFEEFPGLIREGMTELELGRRATEIIYANGATKVDDLLVQSGPNAADPHWLPSQRRIRRGDGIVLDISSTFEGYYADVTRTLSLGAARALRDMYEKVLMAEELGIEAVSEGTPVGDVDAAARNQLARVGLGKYFIHRTGHGLGLEVHEAPYIVEGGKEKLRNGMCFTVEPGAYIRGKVGVRMEDDVLIEDGSAVELTTPPKEFGWWA